MSSQRKEIKYLQKEQKLIEIQRKKFALDLEEDLISEKYELFENQRKIAKDIVTHLAVKSTIFILLALLTQSGKTGIALAIIDLYLKDNLIPIENIYIITGLSSIDWLSQTRKRFPSMLHKRILHRNDLGKTSIINEIKNKQNILLIMDEIQVAAQKDQTIDQFFNDIDLHNRNTLYEKDIKIIELSATPDGNVYDLYQKEKENNVGVIIHYGEPGYYVTTIRAGKYPVFSLDKVISQKNGGISNVKKFKLLTIRIL